jgi:Sec-independent protein translocase protein TatA
MGVPLFHLAYLGPGGPEFLLIMLVLLVMFGAKDAPRILRKLNEIVNQVRNTADSFKREVMYGDLHTDTPSYETPDEHDEDYGYDDDDYYAEDACEAEPGEPEEDSAGADDELKKQAVEEDKSLEGEDDDVR